VKEINMVHYEGDESQRMMARLLFGNALVLERLCVVLVRGTLALQSKLKNEIESWLVAQVPGLCLMGRHHNWMPQATWSRKNHLV
jgi:hypothetical protein